MTDDSGVKAPGEETTTGDSPDVGDTLIPEDAFISPDDPIVRREAEGVPEDAFISPDEPFERHDEPVIGTVVGMDGSAQHHKSLKGIHLGPDAVAKVLEDTAQNVRVSGIKTGLKVSPDASHFETMLKAYLAGYFSTS